MTEASTHSSVNAESMKNKTVEYENGENGRLRLSIQYFFSIAGCKTELT